MDEDRIGAAAPRGVEREAKSWGINVWRTAIAGDQIESSRSDVLTGAYVRSGCKLPKFQLTEITSAVRKRASGPLSKVQRSVSPAAAVSCDSYQRYTLD